MPPKGCDLAAPGDKLYSSATRKTYRPRVARLCTVLSISFEVDVPTGKVGSSLLFERQRCKLSRGVWEHAPTENFEIKMLGNPIFTVSLTVFGP